MTKLAVRNAACYCCVILMRVQHVTSCTFTERSWRHWPRRWGSKIPL